MQKKSYGTLKILKMAYSKKATLSKKRHIFFVLFLFLLQDNGYSCLVLLFQVSKLKIAIEVYQIPLTFFLHNLESSNFLKIQRERLHQKIFQNFTNTFPPDHIINFFLDHPVYIFPRQSLKTFSFCVKLSDSIFFLLGHSPIVNLI